MKTILLLLVFLTPVLAAPVDNQTEQLINAAMQYNFDACNRENIGDVMDSCADEMPDREKFQKETESIFKEKEKMANKNLTISDSFSPFNVFVVVSFGGIVSFGLLSVDSF